MEWKKIPPRKPLETSRDEGGERKVYSREAGDSSNEVTRGGSNEKSYSQSVQPRRRRRISEMNTGRSNDQRGSSYREERSQRPDNQEYDNYKEFQRERASRSDERNYYKEQYNQVRESHRQRFDEENSLEGYQPRLQRPRTVSNNNRNQGHRSHQQQGGNRHQNRSQQGGDNRFRKRNTPQPPTYESSAIEITETIRLNKFLSNAGVCSRREADELIKVGAVLVNGIPVTELGTKITAQDRVEVNGREVKPENKVYVLLNKPRNCVTTTDDPQERMTVMHLVRNACKERIYPVGRLDRNTTGVLLLTNDGDLAAKLVHPSFKKKKIYHVWLDKEVTAEDMQKIADGIELEDGEMHADAISYVTEDDLTQVGIEIHSGRNRIVRRMFEHLGYHVRKLDRVYFAGLTKKNLGRGKWRYLTQDEVNNLLMGAFE